MMPEAGGQIGNGSEHTYYCAYCAKKMTSVSAPWPPVRCPDCGHPIAKPK